MPPEMRQVVSSTVDAIGYDPASRELRVAWKKGRASIYRGVPPEVADSVMKSWSVGQALHDMVKPNFRHSYQQ